MFLYQKKTENIIKKKPSNGKFKKNLFVKYFFFLHKVIEPIINSHPRVGSKKKETMGLLYTKYSATKKL